MNPAVLPNSTAVIQNTITPTIVGTSKNKANITNNMLKIIFNISSFFILYEIYILYPTKTGLKITGIMDEKYYNYTPKVVRKCCSDWVLYMRSADRFDAIPGVF